MLSCSFPLDIGTIVDPQLWMSCVNAVLISLEQLDVRVLVLEGGVRVADARLDREHVGEERPLLHVWCQRLKSAHARPGGHAGHDDARRAHALQHVLIGVAGVGREVVGEGRVRPRRALARDALHVDPVLGQHLAEECAEAPARAQHQDALDLAHPSFSASAPRRLGLPAAPSTSVRLSTTVPC
eukprot:CAMPEP_0206278748 /NCGR_PEP_ID=MMETSP0047_2-20121206/37587_1 /ASSEMBLY_ACC=CAM_ASM_000192 /TAXON_ID=195065 /ORGANISM="Chroomonas mesostigmatica_cf, Strain CCMP1168" /LENGTH=183 /DNA_ID=CAMNT_0053708517 /DNA_START=447 /DNA_END=995 /DNA_ORIENTATION=-